MQRRAQVHPAEPFLTADDLQKQLRLANEPLHETMLEINATLKQLRDVSLEVRNHVEWIVPVSASYPIVVDYKNRDKLFVYSTTALSLSAEDLGTISIPANTWIDISLGQGYRLYAVGQATQVFVLLRATDDFMTSPSFNLAQVGGANIALGQNTMANSLPVVLASNQSAIPVTTTPGGGIISQTVGLALPPAATAVNASATGTNAAAVATLTGVAAKFTYLTSVILTASGAVAAATTATITGVPGGPLTIEIPASVAATPLEIIQIAFTVPLQSSAVNTNIVVTLNALGTGIIGAVIATGYVQ